MKKIITILVLIIANQISAQSISTIYEIYNFDVGDVFHIRQQYNNSPPITSRIKILDKYYSSNHDTLFYIKSANSFVAASFPGDSIIYQNSIDTTFFTSLDSIIDKAVDSVFSNPNLYNGRIINYYDTCIEGCGFEPHVLYHTYVNGCGDYLDDDYSSQSYEYHRYLVYYKKGTETWGEPILTFEKEILHPHNKIVICPNPTSDYFTINFEDYSQPYTLRIINTQGKIVKENDFQPGYQNLVSIGDLRKGIYFVEIVFSNNSFVTTLIKN